MVLPQQELVYFLVLFDVVRNQKSIAAIHAHNKAVEDETLDMFNSSEAHMFNRGQVFFMRTDVLVNYKTSFYF